jgi:hypothetical protein
MFRTVPKLLGFLLLVLGVAALLPVSKDARAQFIGINGNHQVDPKFPPIFDKGFRPGFGKAPVRSSPYRQAGQYILGQQGNQGNQGGGQQGQFGNQGQFGGQFGGQGGQFGIGGGQFGQGGIGGGGLQGQGGGIISFGGVSGTPPFAIQTMPQIGGTNYLGAQGGIFGLTGGSTSQQGIQGGQFGFGQGGALGGVQGGFQGIGGGQFQGGFGGQQGGGFGGFGGGIQGAFGGNAGFVGKQFGASGGSGY